MWLRRRRIFSMLGRHLETAVRVCLIAMCPATWDWCSLLEIDALILIMVSCDPQRYEIALRDGRCCSIFAFYFRPVHLFCVSRSLFFFFSTPCMEITVSKVAILTVSPYSSCKGVPVHSHLLSHRYHERQRMAPSPEWSDPNSLRWMVRSRIYTGSRASH